MKQKLLADIELDVHELKYLMDSFTKEPTQTLSELLKRSVARMQGRLDELSQEIDSVELVSLSSFVVEETVVKENETIAQEKDASVIIQSPEPVIEARTRHRRGPPHNKEGRTQKRRVGRKHKAGCRLAPFYQLE